MSAREVRVSLDETDFAHLVQGAVVEREARDQDGKPVLVKVALKDIGFDRIYAAVGEAHVASSQGRSR